MWAELHMCSHARDDFYLSVYFFLSSRTDFELNSTCWNVWIDPNRCFDCLYSLFNIFYFQHIVIVYIPKHKHKTVWLKLRWWQEVSVPHTKVNINTSFKNLFEMSPETQQQVRLSERRSSLTPLKRELPGEGLPSLSLFHLSTLTREPPRATAQITASSTSRAKGHGS